MINYKQITVAKSDNYKIKICGLLTFIKTKNFPLLLVAYFITITQTFGQLTALQKAPATAAPGSSIIIKISINRGPINGFMKFSQAIPEGYTAVELDSKNGDFRYENNETKIIWLKAPAEVTYTVAFKIKVPKNAAGTITLGGKITYVTNSNERKVFDFPIKKISITNTLEKVGSKSSKNETTGNTSYNTTNKKTKETIIEPESPAIKTTAKIADPVATESLPAPTLIKKKYSFRKGGLEADTEEETEPDNTNSGKKFKVQIGAFRQSTKIKNVPDHTTIVVDNITKHFSGNFSTYEEASERKNQMIDQGFKGAFIVTFSDPESEKIPKVHVCKNWWHCLKLKGF